MAWVKADLSIPAAEQVNDVQDALQDFFEKFLAINQDVILPALEILALVQERQDLVATAASAALTAVANALDDFIKDAAGYLLVVNPLKPYGDLISAPDVDVDALPNIIVQRLIQNPPPEILGAGGNYGLYRKIVESLYDRGDLSRPQPDSDAWVGGFLIVFGSDSYLSLLQGLLQLQDIFGPSIPVPMDGFQLPVPQNVKAKPVSVSKRELVGKIPVFLGDTQETVPYAVRLKWDAEPLLKKKPAYGNFEYRIKSWTVYVKEGREPILPGENLDDYKKHEFEFFSGDVPITRQILTTAAYSALIRGLKPDSVYHIAVAYTVEVTNRDLNEKAIFKPTYESLSAQKRVALEEQAPVSQFLDGTPPDWIAIASPLAIFPQFRQILAEIQEGVLIVRDTFADVNNELSGLIEYVRRRLEEIEAFLDRLATGFGALENLFPGFDIGIYVAPFEGRGGIPFFIRTLNELLFDTSDENRPPFDRGDEVVAGMVMLTESETKSAVEDFIAVGELFTGTSGTNNGFTVTDINREEREAVSNQEDTETTRKSLVELGLADEDPC